MAGVSEPKKIVCQPKTSSQSTSCVKSAVCLLMEYPCTTRSALVQFSLSFAGLEKYVWHCLSKFYDVLFSIKHPKDSTESKVFFFSVLYLCLWRKGEAKIRWVEKKTENSFSPRPGDSYFTSILNNCLSFGVSDLLNVKFLQTYF